ncbi:MAG: sortase [bacterium]|nr:sortase [bacterium]
MLFVSPTFKKIFLIRFLGYFFIQLGILALILTVEPVVSEELRYRFNDLTGKHYSLPRVVTSQGENNQPSSSLGSLNLGGTEMITPVSTDFGIVIEKINANAKVVPDVNPSDEKSYMAALSQGVAHAKGTSYPGQKGNIYLFSHSTDAPWNIVRFNAIFFLLGKLEPEDRVIMFYQGRRYDYIVFDKRVVPPSETKYLTDKYDQSVLTLQTCDPPGTILNRLIIRAKLVES